MISSGSPRFEGAQVVPRLGADEVGQRRAREALLGGGEEGLQIRAGEMQVTDRSSRRRGVQKSVARILA
jgi:hypothetical protein